MKNVVRFRVGICLAAVALVWIPVVKAGERKEEKKHHGIEYLEGTISSIDAKIISGNWVHLNGGVSPNGSKFKLLVGKDGILATEAH